MAAVAGSSRDALANSPEPFAKSLKGRLQSSMTSIRHHTSRTKGKTAADEVPPTSFPGSKGKAKVTPGPESPNDVRKSTTPMLKRLESRVSSFRPSPSSHKAKPDAFAAGPTQHFQIPSLRAASMSDPTLTLSAQTHRSRPPLLVGVIADVFAPLPSSSPSPPPPRDRTTAKRSSYQPPPSSSREISGPSPLRRSVDSPRVHAHREPARSSVDLPRTAARSPEPPRVAEPTTTTATNTRRGKPPPLYPTVAIPSSPPRRAISPPTSPVDTPTRRPRDHPSSPTTPTPPSASRNLGSMARAASSSSALPLTPTAADRAVSPLRAISPSSNPRRVTPARGLSSSSASHLPLGSTPRRTSNDFSRPSLDASTRRPSLEARVSTQSNMSDSPSTSRAASPRGMTPSPVPGSYQRRVRNTSSSSTGTTSSPEHRDLIRAASSLLCRELGRGGGQLRRNGFSEQDWEETENRMRNLIRLERMWGRSGTGAQGNGSSVSGASGEDRERRAFTEALRDGYVLCQFMNKLRPGSLTNPSTRDDGFVRTSNVTRFLATCSQQGVPAEDLFQRDDLIEASAESLARVARAVLSLFKITEAPTSAERSRILTGGGGGGSSGTQRGPYASSRATESTPNLALARSASPTVNSTQKKRWSPPTAGLPTVIDHDLDTFRETLGPARPPQVNTDNRLLVSPPPKSPLRTRSNSSRGGMFVERGSLADRVSLGDSLSDSRQSLASSTRTDTTGFSSLLEVQRSTSSGSAGQFGTVRTMTTDATSIHVNDDGSFSASISEELGRKQPDLQRVVEETDSAATSSSGGKKKPQSNMSSSTELGKTDAADLQERERERKKRINLGKAKWPEDFFDATQQNPNAAALAEEFGTDGSITPPLSASPTPLSNLSLAMAMAARKDQSNRVEPPPLTPKRPSHRARHSVDTGGLLPRPPRLRTEFGEASPTRAGLRRSNTQNSAGAGPRSAGLLPRADRDNRSQSREAGLSPRVPFPRSTSGEYNLEGSPRQHSPLDFGSSADRPRVPRGRFTSEVDGASSRRRPRPNSFDVQGSKPGRSRFESMVNLGGESSMPIASDINSRDSVDVRQTLVVKEDGKAAVQYQLGNCIGRGQFGSVYRALNLNTGQMVAIKRIRLEGLKEDEIKQLMGEVDLVKSLSHPSIVKYEGMARDPTTLNIVLEFAENGSLGQTLKAFGKLNERLVASYVVKILDGLFYLHQSHVVHCDLKAANILTTKTGNVKLSDFGVSLNLRNLRHMEKERKDVAGTPNWMAPEVIELKGASYASDIWSLACTVIELLTGKPPYSDVPNSMSVMFRIVEDDMPPLPEGCSELLEDFLRLCFNKDPSKRPTAEALCEHEWLKVTWVAGKELRQQDSIPFLRRVSTDVKQSSPSIARYLGQMENTPKSEMGDSDDGPKATPNKRNSNATSAGRPPFSDTDSIVSPREHCFVKTAFGKPMTCRVCMQSVKKSAVICGECSLIAHQKCAPNAPLSCDLRAQFLMYAESNTGFAQAADYFAASQARSVGSSPPTEGSVPSPRTSFDVHQTSSSATSPSPNLHPPVAFKGTSPFKRSRSSLSSPEPAVAPSTPSMKDEIPVRARRRSVLKRSQPSQERPLSIGSSSTGPNTSSMRSALTAAESFSSNHGGNGRESITTETELGRFSQISAADARSRSSRMTTTTTASNEQSTSNGVPGSMPPQHHRLPKREKSNGNCILQ